MKIQFDFVSNSSCASFVIPKKYLSRKQINLIHNHIERSYDYIVHRGPQTQLYNQLEDAWRITETDDTIKCDTMMDNFDMTWFLLQIGVDEDYIEYEGCY